MIARIAYLTSPQEGRYVLNFQTFGSEELIQIDVAPESFKNILADGVRLMLHSSYHRVPVNQSEAKRNDQPTQSVR